MPYADEELHNVLSNPLLLLEKELFEGQLMQAAREVWIHRWEESALLFAGPEGAAKGTAIVYVRVKDLIVAGICPESDASL